MRLHRPSTSLLVLVSLCLAALHGGALGAATARADGPRVAVLPFEGSESIGARLAVHDALEDEGVELVSLSRAADVARRARVRGLSRRHLRRALQLAEADVSVQGRTEVVRGEVELHVVVAMADGEILLEQDAALDELEALAREVNEALGHPPSRALASRVGRADASDAREPEDDRGSERSARGRARARSRQDEEADEQVDEIEGESGPPPELPWLVAGIGGAARMRDASFDAADGTRFHRAWYPSIDLQAELRPFHGASGAERGLFLRAAFYHSVGLRSRGPNDTIVDTAFFGLSADAGLLVTVTGDWDVGFALGVGVDSFALAETPSTLVPTAVYGTLRPGLRARGQLLDELVVLDLGVGYRWVFERGPIAAAFGQDGESHGFEAGATLGGSVDVGFSWAVSADVVGVVHQFHGEAASVPASGGRDIGVRIGARLGLALR
jgi:hypothetical protein